MIDRDDILSQAVHKCLLDLYKWAQPSIDFDKLLASGYKDTEENPLYKRHYLSSANYDYIINSYINAYGMREKWNDTFELLIEYLTKGGLKSKYVNERKKYEEVPSIYKYLDKEDADIVLSLIYECQHFYKIDREANNFKFTMALRVASPNTNKEIVQDYWRVNGYPEFTILDYDIESVIYGYDDKYLTISEEDFIKNLKSETPNIYGI